MSRNNKYIQQFDRNSGKPADFDNLFAFEGEELIAKRKIRAVRSIRSKGKRAAFMGISVAAVIIAAFIGLSYFNEISRTDDISISEGADMGNEEVDTVLNSGAVPDKDGEYLLSELISRFDYYIQSADNTDVMPALEDAAETYRYADIVMNARVICKYRDDNNDIGYAVRPIWYYYGSELVDSHSMQILDSSPIITVTAYSFDEPDRKYCELQAGSEYILAVNAAAEGETDFSLRSPGSFPIRWMDDQNGWLVCGECGSLAEGAEHVGNDVEGFYIFNDLGLVYGHDAMEKRIGNLLAGSSTEIYFAEGLSIEENNSPVMISDLFEKIDGREFESMAYGTDGSGNIDKSIIVLDNNEYFVLAPDIKGGAYVIFAGENAFGENTVALFAEKVEDNSPIVAVFTGIKEVQVSEGDHVNGNVIGTCSTDPICFRFFDISGPMEIDISEAETEDMEAFEKHEADIVTIAYGE